MMMLGTGPFSSLHKKGMGFFFADVPFVSQLQACEDFRTFKGSLASSLRIFPGRSQTFQRILGPGIVGTSFSRLSS